jgi:aspartate carbamoyltransferase catalytic subunit
MGGATMKLSEIAWNEFHNLSLAEKGKLCKENEHMFHVLVAQQFEREDLDGLGQLATRIRFIAKSEEGMKFLQGILAHKHAMLYFSQPSTRTFLSFCSACQILGMSLGNVRDTSTSSEYKGESQEDSVRTFSSYFDIIIMRSQRGGLAERMAWLLSNSERPVPIINAGSGKDQHPTQALLDIYTLQRSFENIGGIDGKRIVFVGDLARGRTVRSLSSLLTKYKNVSQCFVAPGPLQVKDDIVDLLKRAGVDFELSDDFEAKIPEADAIYMTRIQDEWDTNKGDSASIDTSRFCFTAEHLDILKPTGIIMHPLPRRNEISTDVDHDPRAMYWRQMRNGMWIRAALIASVFERDALINEYYLERVASK